MSNTRWFLLFLCFIGFVFCCRQWWYAHKIVRKYSKNLYTHDITPNQVLGADSDIQAAAIARCWNTGKAVIGNRDPKTGEITLKEIEDK